MDTSLLRFRSLLKEHYLTASQTIFDSDDPRTWKSVCLKCNSAHTLRGAPDILSGRIVTKSYYPVSGWIFAIIQPDNLFFMKCTKFPSIEI